MVRKRPRPQRDDEPRDFRGYHDAVWREYFHHGRNHRGHYVRYTWGREIYLGYYPHFHDRAPSICIDFYRTGHWEWDPFHYSWVWVDRDWWNWASVYFVPYRDYRSPGHFVTDYVLSQILYEARDDYAWDYKNAILNTISTRDKERIRRQIEGEIAQNQYDGEAPLSAFDLMGDPSEIFIATDPVFAWMDNSDMKCTIAEDDLLSAFEPPYEGDEFVLMKVRSSAMGTCPIGSLVYVSLDDVQMFRNDVLELIGDGLNRLERERGQLVFVRRRW